MRGRVTEDTLSAQGTFLGTAPFKVGREGIITLFYKQGN